LSLQMVDVADGFHWRWLLTEEATGQPLANHTVDLDPSSAEAVAFADLYQHLRWNAVPDRRVTSETELVAQVGTWIGREVLGVHVGRAIVDAAPVTVRVWVPPEAEFMLFSPLELAYVDGVSLAARGEVSLAFELGGTASVKGPVADRLRMLAVFSLPTGTSALALRRERYALSRLIRRIAARERRMVELQVLQYGVTRGRLKEVVEDGWDLLHLSGHGGAGEFLLERADGSPDPVTTQDLVRMLRPTRRWVKLAVVSACQSASATSAEMLRWLRLNEQAEELEERANREAEGPGLTAIAPELARQLDCAVVAMRYPVTDDFAIGLADEFYDRLLRRGHSLDAAFRRAVSEAAGPEPTAARPAISVATPALFGTHAAGLQLRPPLGEPMLDPARERMADFEPEPERFVGRVQTMAEASDALAPGSGRTTIVLYGMVGAGKTACALELAYRHQDAFAALAWWRAPLREEAFGGALADLALALEKQLGDRGFAMVDKIGTVEQLERFLPRLRAMLESAGLLLVLDNLETLLTPAGGWRDPRWKSLVDALTGHRGESRVIMTSRIRPGGLNALVLPVHALSRDETAALARELPHLRALLHTDAGPLRGEAQEDRELVRRVLNIVQGNPELLKLADAAARNPEELAVCLAAAEQTGPDEGTLSAFLRSGTSDLDANQFLDVLAQWTKSSLESLPEGAVLLLRILCYLEDQDRWSSVIEHNWASVWRRLDYPGDAPDLSATLDILAAAALVNAEWVNDVGVRYRLHPGIIESVNATTDAAEGSVIDTELAACWTMAARTAFQREDAEISSMIAYASLAAVPYLIRIHEWDTAVSLLENTMLRDPSPRIGEPVVAHLRRIVDITHAADGLAVLADALFDSDPAEAERLNRALLQQDFDNKDYPLAVTRAGSLADLLDHAGRPSEALVLAEEMSVYIRHTRIGPWGQLGAQCRRLRILASLGEHEHVLEEVVRLRAAMNRLPDIEEDGTTGNAAPWKIREATLAIGHRSAQALERWSESLALNAEILASKRRRNASALDMVVTRFNDHFSLAALGRVNEAEEVVLAYQLAAEQHGHIAMLAEAFVARAHLEARCGHLDAAAALEATALRYLYLQPNPRKIFIAHHNLANHLRPDTDPIAQRAHRIAATVLARLTGSAHDLDRSMRMLTTELREAEQHITLRQVIEVAERTEGVRLGALIGTLASYEDAKQSLAETLKPIIQ